MKRLSMLAICLAGSLTAASDAAPGGPRVSHTEAARQVQDFYRRHPQAPPLSPPNGAAPQGAPAAPAQPPPPPPPPVTLPPATPEPTPPEPAATDGGRFETDTDRPGGDYTSFDLSAPDPGTCQAACARDNRCRAWTYVRPGYQGSGARCWLKGSVPTAIASACCISGHGGDDAATTPRSAGPERTFSNGNIYGVANGGRPPWLEFATAGRVTYIMTYHWNDARGRTPGTIALVSSDGRTYGPWQAIGQPGQGGVPDAYWIVRPDEVVPAGRYQLIDSDPDTWAQNSGSGGVGMIELHFIPQ